MYGLLYGLGINYFIAYLTHDATSVRKNHLTGKNHVKLVADYYEGMYIGCYILNINLTIIRGS